MQNLITAEEFAQYKDIGQKIDNKKINDCITQAQQVDLYDVLGNFIYDVIANRENPEYADLMAGSKFTVDGFDYEHIGLKAYLADLTYPRYLYKLNMNLTPFGAQQKFTQDSSPVDRNLLKDTATQCQVDSAIKFKMIRCYIESKRDVFTRYCGGNNQSIHTYSQRFSKL